VEVSVKWVEDFMASTADILEFVDKFCYLGDMLGKGGRAYRESVKKRVRCAWKIFNELAQISTM